MRDQDDLKKFIPFVGAALGIAGRLVGSYIASRGVQSLARRTTAAAGKVVRGFGAAAMRSGGAATSAASGAVSGAKNKGVLQILGDLGRSNIVQGVGFGSTAYGVYDTYKTGQENAAYRNALAQERQGLAQARNVRGTGGVRQTRANRALSQAQSDADNDGVPNEASLPEDRRNFSRGAART